MESVASAVVSSMRYDGDSCVDLLFKLQCRLSKQLKFVWSVNYFFQPSE